MSIPRSSAIAAARSESSMKTMALTAETASRLTQSRMHVVVRGSRPQSSAFTISTPPSPRSTGVFIRRVDGRWRGPSLVTASRAVSAAAQGVKRRGLRPVQHRNALAISTDRPGSRNARRILHVLDGPRGDATARAPGTRVERRRSEPASRSPARRIGCRSAARGCGSTSAAIRARRSGA